MFASLRWLDANIPSLCVVCSAHDYSNSFASLWESERATNPLLELALDDSNPLARAMFVAAKVEYDEGGRVSFVDAANGRYTTIEGDCRVVYLPQA